MGIVYQSYALKARFPPFYALGVNIKGFTKRYKVEQKMNWITAHGSRYREKQNIFFKIFKYSRHSESHYLHAQHYIR